MGFALDNNWRIVRTKVERMKLFPIAHSYLYRMVLLDYNPSGSQNRFRRCLEVSSHVSVTD
jgi:hypothetical protein